jgi:hypothetical protein
MGGMRQAYAYEAEIDIAYDGDLRAPGAAITEELCGAIDHEPPCPLAAHHTSTKRSGDLVTVRVLFACEPADESTVRDDIDAALERGEHSGADGGLTHWRLVTSGPSEVRDSEAGHAGRLSTG